MEPEDQPGTASFLERAEQQQMPDLAAAMSQMQQIQQQMLEAQEKIANSEVHGQAGGGLVQVTLNGSGQVTAVRIDPKVVDPDDVETLQDLIIGAFADGSRQMATMVQSHLGPLAGGMPGGVDRLLGF